MEKERNRLRLEFFKKDDYKNIKSFEIRIFQKR